MQLVRSNGTKCWIWPSSSFGNTKQVKGVVRVWRRREYGRRGSFAGEVMCDAIRAHRNITSVEDQMAKT